MRKIAIPFFVMFAIFCALCGSSYAANANVSVVDNAFLPQTVTINAGDTVTWTLNGFAPHTTTSGAGCVSDGLWNSGTLGSQPFQMVFNTPGTYPYFCIFHCGIGMTGTVIVNAAVIPAPVGQNTFFFQPVATPVVGSSRNTSMPIGIGSLATGGNTLTVAIALGPYAVPVDIYAAFIVSNDPLTVVNIRPDLEFENLTLNDVTQALSTGVVPASVVPWMSNASTGIDVTLFSNVPIANIASGQYTANLLVTPHGGTLADFDLYRTIFTIP